MSDSVSATLLTVSHLISVITLYVVGFIIILILQLRRPKLRKVKQFMQDYTFSELPKDCSNLGRLLL